MTNPKLSPVEAKIVNVITGVVFVLTLGVPLLVMNGCVSFLTRPQEPKSASQIAAEDCAGEANVAGRLSGPPTFKFASEATVDYALMHFEKRGVQWTTKYVCE